MDLTDWTFASELPPQLEGYHTSEYVLVLLGVTQFEVTVAFYNHTEGKWQGNDGEEYGLHISQFVTYWKYIGPLPPPLPAEFIKLLEPDYVSDETPMRALFAGVDSTDKGLHKTLRETISDNGLTEVFLWSYGMRQKTFYYVDFRVRDPLELRHIKQQLSQLDVPFTIAPKE